MNDASASSATQHPRHTSATAVGSPISTRGREVFKAESFRRAIAIDTREREIETRKHEEAERKKKKGGSISGRGKGNYDIYLVNKSVEHRLQASSVLDN